MRIKFFGAAQSWRGLVKIAKSLDFRQENPGSEPEAVPALQNPQKLRKVFLIMLSQFLTDQPKILNTIIKPNFPWSKILIF